ncbi:hypothetical protein RUM44_013850 [Polyplax serrata]|uniref:BHLH domain-containing protein n=1 Tax=Polyplax serrata TaxID=468196 RepID=A0ABR1BFL7_POLSC
MAIVQWEGHVYYLGNRIGKYSPTSGRECRLSDRTVSPRSHMEQEKRIRREIANSNERRRMQSINAGFQSLRTLLPGHEGEKLSKYFWLLDDVDDDVVRILANGTRTTIEGATAFFY